MAKRLRFPGPDETVLRSFPRRDRYLVAVSGGRDSVALLDWLTRNGYRNLIVCHLNHKLRGRCSDADARFVDKLATKLGLDGESGTTDVRRLVTKRKMSIELAARSARYAFFARVAKRRRCTNVIVGHHADDLVETFLINLFRGAGASGLGGIRSVSQQRLENIELQVIRPLLEVWRSDVDKYVRVHGVEFREDASNDNLQPLRNRIRHRVIPYLEKNLGRGIRQNIWRTAMILSADENFFSELLPEMNTDGGSVAVGTLRALGIPLQRRVLHKWLRSSEVAEVGFDLIERVRGLLDVATGPARTNLPRDRHVRRRAGKLFLE